MNNIRNKIVGRWLIDEVRYSIVTRKIILDIHCIGCLKKLKVEVDKVEDLGNLSCDTCKEKDKESNFIGNVINDKESYSIDLKEKVKNNGDEYVVNKLRIVWNGINKRDICNEWLGDFKEFRDWSYKNDYKPWKVLDRYDNNVGYTPGNCYWRLDNRGIPNNLKRINIENTVSNSIKYLKDVSYNLEDIRMKLAILGVKCDELLGSNHIINKRNIWDCRINIAECEEYLIKCSELLDNINLRI